MSKMTEGPWIITWHTVNNIPFGFSIVGSIERGAETIAETRWGVIEGRKRTEELEANARAIVALPELMEAAEALCSVRAGMVEHIPDPHNKKVAGDLFSALRSALAKAKGE